MQRAKRYVWFLVVATFVLGWIPNAKAGCTGSSPTWASTLDQASVQTCITNATAGDTINVGAGTQTWSGLTINKAVNLIGAGSANSIVNGGFTISVAAVRVSGFTFNTGSGYLSVFAARAFRIDNNVLNTTGDTNIYMVGYTDAQQPIEGLIDHNTMNGKVKFYGEQSGVNYTGRHIWAQPLNLGTSHAVYVEDNTFNLSVSSSNYANSTDGNWGCRYVIRFNTFNGGRIESHGLQGYNERGCMLWEDYNNTMRGACGTPCGGNNTSNYRPFLLRGGTGRIFHNTSDNNYVTNNIFIDTLRTFEVSIAGMMNGGTPLWNMCGEVNVPPWTAQPNGSSWVDGNTPGGYGYPCRDQIGVATDSFLWNYAQPAPSQQFAPAYLWRNTQSGAEIPVLLNCDNSGINCSIQSTYIVVQNRDYYTYNASFDGTSGVGEGLIASRPSTCTTGVAYWATDQGSWNTKLASNTSGQLYTCTSANTWTLSYVPYTYPHPLQSGSAAAQVAPPTNLTATAR